MAGKAERAAFVSGAAAASNEMDGGKYWRGFTNLVTHEQMQSSELDIWTRRHLGLLVFSADQALTVIYQ